MTPEQLLRTLQISDTLFPTGGFAFSDGLETAVTNGIVSDGESFEKWLRSYIADVFVPCDGLALKRAMTADADTLRKLDTELTAMKPSAATRMSSATLGRRFLKAISALDDISPMAIEVENLPIVYGVVCAKLGFEEKHALLAFAYNRLAASTSAALRLMSIGQQQGQAILSRVLESVPAAVERVMTAGNAELTCFAPLLDIQQMNHRYVYSRLFRS